MASSCSILRPLAWYAGLLGLGLFTFGTVGLSGPGRIDSVEGQISFEVGRSLVEHGDFEIRDGRAWWGRFPGRNGKFYSFDHLPLSLTAAGAIRVADFTGPASEGRRHFVFVLSGAAACSLLSIVYAVWFKHVGCRPFVAILWAAGGIFCTPAWFYGTSVSEDYLGTLVVTTALVTAALTRHRAGTIGAIAAGLLFGVAYGCDKILAIYVLAALAWHDNPRLQAFQRTMRCLLILGGLLLGIAADYGYDHFKFPSDKDVIHLANDGEADGPTFVSHQLQAMTALLFSPAAGAVWYYPPLLITLTGLRSRWKTDRRAVPALCVSALGFLGFIASLAPFKGDPCWGPRYLTPLFGILWLFAPAGAARAPKSAVAVLLSLGAIVQLLALSVDVNRLAIQEDVSPEFGRSDPWRYFNSSLSHILNRPREIVDIARSQEHAQEFSPAPAPTYAFPIVGQRFLEHRGPDMVQRFQVLNSYRPWWASMTWLPSDERPVNIGKFAAVLLMFVSSGLILLGLASRGLEVSPANH